MIIRQKYINGKDSITIRMYYSVNRILEKYERVDRVDLYEDGEYILPDIYVSGKQYEKILRSLHK
jgi:hypothetical protein